MNGEFHLTRDNYRSFARVSYERQRLVSMEEFEKDLKKIMYLKRLFTRYVSTGDLQKQLILNHITMLYNVFGNAAASLLFFKIDNNLWPIMAAFMAYKKKLPAKVYGLDISTDDIVLDQDVVSALGEAR